MEIIFINIQNILKWPVSLRAPLSPATFLSSPSQGEERSPVRGEYSREDGLAVVCFSFLLLEDRRQLN